MGIKVSVLAGVVSSFFAKASLAAVLSGSVTGGSAELAGGTFVELDPASAFTVGDDNQQSNNLFAFNEDQNITLGSDLNYNGGTISAGTVVASHYVFFDPGLASSISGSVTFDATIIGVATSTADLAASDFLITNAVTYLNPTFRGLESRDIFSVIGDTLTVNFFARTPGDYVRVFTERSPSFPDNTDPSAGGTIPLPAAFWMLLAGVGGLGIVARKQKKSDGA